jgi:hypothetical protein
MDCWKESKLVCSLENTMVEKMELMKGGLWETMLDNLME